MAMLLSRARLGLRAGQALRSAEQLSSYSDVGSFSTFSFRMRYTILLKNQTDPTIADFFYEKWLHAWVADAPSYNYWFVSSLAMGLAVGIVSRHFLFNPDVYARRLKATVSSSRRKSRKAYFTAPSHISRELMSSPLSKNLTACAPCPSAAIINRGHYKDREGEVAQVYRNKWCICTERVTRDVANRQTVPIPIHPFKVIITKLNLDRDRKVRKPFPDRHRQWSFSLPYFNHRMRNFSTKYKWCLIDNEPDWADYHPIGYRPNRKPIHRRPYMWIFSIPRYTCEDPLFTSVTHENMNRIYAEIGYSKPAFPEVEEEA